MCLLGEGAGPRDPMLLSLLVLDVAVLSLVAAVNCCVSAAVLRRRRLLFSACPASRFVLNMCAADLGMAAAACYYKAFVYVCPAKRALSASWPACLARFSAMSLCFLASSHSLVLLAFDRYCAVVHALRYRQIVSQSRSWRLVATVWLLSAVVASWVFVWNHWSPQRPCEEQYVLSRWYVVVVILVTHGLVFAVVAGTHLKIYLLASRAHQGRPLLRRPSAKVLILLTSSYVACWTPFLLVFGVRQSLRDDNELVERLYNVTFSLAFLTYITNSFIFSWKNKLVRAAVIELFSCGRRNVESAATPITISVRQTDAVT